jgi:multisubunit Na+/H+ antiporter MnhG subunit
MKRKMVRIAAAALIAVTATVLTTPATAHALGTGKVSTQDFHFVIG